MPSPALLYDRAPIQPSIESCTYASQGAAWARAWKRWSRERAADLRAGAGEARRKAEAAGGRGPLARGRAQGSGRGARLPEDLHRAPGGGPQEDRDSPRRIGLPSPIADDWAEG